MNKYAFYIFIACVTFVIGAIFTFNLITKPTQENYITLVNEPEINESKLPESAINELTLPELPTLTEIENEYLHIFGNNLDNSKIRLRWLIKYKKVRKKQTIYLSEDYIYAYWVEDNSLIIVSAIDAQNAKFGDFNKAYIDLEKGVLPKEKILNPGSLGCCLVTKDWVDEIIAKCKKGIKLKL